MCNGTNTAITKYCTSTDYGTVDNKTVLDPADDAAHVNWGDSWRMPTDAEWTELRTKCTWSDFITDYKGTGVAGYTVTGTNGNSIFLPAAGFRGGSSFSVAESYGYYWSSSLAASSSTSAYRVGFYSDGVSRGSNGRIFGHSVRPVTE